LRAYLTEQDYTFVATREEMNKAQADKLFGLFAPGLLTAEVDRRAGAGATEPTLREMTEKALDVLARDPQGFFLMVEGAQVDKANHVHDFPWATYDLLAFDDAVAHVLAWAEKHPDTLVLIAPDHETGGLTILNEPTEGARTKALASVTKKTTGTAADYFVGYSTTWHTGVDVFLAGNTPTCRPMRNCDILEAITGATATTLTEIQGTTLTENGITWLVTADGKRLRAQRDAIYIRSTGKWYQR
jgi:alkaline phosphatase